MDKIINWFKKIPQDKLLHVVVASALTAIIKFGLSFTALSAPMVLICTLAFVLLISVAKEVYDELSEEGTPELNDLLADLIGVVIGLL